MACHRVAIGELKRPAVLAALRSLTVGVGVEVTALHVVFGERGMQHFIATAPPLAVDDLRQFVVRECRRLGSLPADVELMGHCWRLPSKRGKQLRIAAICVPRSAWQPIESAIRELGLQVVSLTSTEYAMAAAIPARLPVDSAALEISAGKARFVLCEGHAVVQSRRFVLPPGVESGQDSSMVRVLLSMEVPRTLEYLAEVGCVRPEGLLVSHRVCDGDDETADLAHEIPVCERYVPPATIEGGVNTPGLATFGMLTRLRSSRAALHTLSSGISVRIPRSPLRVAGAVAAVVVSLAGGGATILGNRAGDEARAARLVAEETLRRLGAELAEKRGSAGSLGVMSAERKRLLEILSTRRPYSLLISMLSNAAPAAVSFESIEFGPADRVSVSGEVAAGDRLLGLERMGEFLDAIRAIPFVASDGREVIRGVEGDGAKIAFVVNLSWCSP